MMIKLAFALVAATALATAAQAVPYNYQLTGWNPNTGTVDPSKYTANFVLESTATPNGPIIANQSFRFNGVTINYTLPNSVTPYTDNGPFDGPTFSVNTNGFSGGVNIIRLDQAGNFGNGIFLYGPQLFTGTTANPVLSLGTFLLSDIQPPFSGSPLQVNYRLVVSQVAAIPESSTWAMMIGGFGLLGAGLRRRSVRVRFA